MAEASKDLATLDDLNNLAGGVPQKFTADDAAEMLKSPFLPRLDVGTGQSAMCQDGRVAMGSYALVYDKNRADDLGKEIDFLVIAYRPKALEIPKVGNPMSYFNRNDAAFQRVQSRSGIQDSGCMFGLEFLVWMPMKRTFATLFLGTQSKRREAPALLNEMKKNPDGTEREDYGWAKATGKTELVSNAKGRWHIPRFYPCTSELASLPEKDTLITELEKFNNPPESAVEDAPADAAPGRAR